MTTDTAKFESWGIVEVMGHSRFAGFISSQAIGGCNMVRIDVPEIAAEPHVEARPAFTKLFTQQAIFGITPTDEATARQAARSFQARPLSMFALPAARLPYQPTDDDDEEFDDEDL